MKGQENFSQLPWFLMGIRGLISGPAIILMGAMVGFCGFAYEAGIPMVQAAFMTGIVWALPAQFVLIGAMLAGASLPTAALAVALSSMRLLPMVASLVPEIRTRTTPTWLLLLLSHFVAVTSWVLTMESLGRVPREGRVAFLAGFGLTMGCLNVTLVAVCYGIIDRLPDMIGGTLFFLTPVYFLTSIWASARHVEVYFALIIGIILGPVFHLADEELGLLLAGLIGGTLAFLLQRIYIRYRPGTSSPGA